MPPRTPKSSLRASTWPSGGAPNTSRTERIVRTAPESGGARPLLSVLLVVALAGGCAPAPDLDVHANSSFWPAPADSSIWLPIRDAAGGACQSCLTFVPVVTIAGDELPVGTRWVSADSLGRLWLGDVTGPSVFTSEGTFVGKVGRSGQGPLEFAAAGPIFTTNDGHVHVVDPNNGRWTTLSETFEVLREQTFSGGRIQEALPLGGSERLVLNATIGTPERLGLPLHILSGDGLTVSFGNLEEGVIPLGLGLWRRISVDEQQNIFSAAHFSYQIDVWTPEGRRILGLRKSDAWREPPGGMPLALSRDHPPGGLMIATRHRGASLLEVISWVPKDTWAEELIEVVLPDGMIDLTVAGPYSDLFDPVVELIDLASGRVVARAEAPSALEGFLYDDMVFGHSESSDGFPSLTLYRLEWSGAVIP
jgi:hypothetical protein